MATSSSSSALLLPSNLSLRLRPRPRAAPLPLPLPARLSSSSSSSSSRRMMVPFASYKVTIEHEGKSRTVEVEEEETILGKALEEGLEVPHDCKLGVCMTCPARLVSGSVDQSEGMLSDDVVDKGYALLCVSYPRSDCHIKTIPEDELLSLQLATAND